MPYTVHPSVICTRLSEHEGILLHTETEYYFTLNETGLVLWDLLATPRTPAALADSLSALYEIEAEEALPIVKDFLEDLEEGGLVREAEAP